MSEPILLELQRREQEILEYLTRADVETHTRLGKEALQCPAVFDAFRYRRMAF